MQQQRSFTPPPPPPSPSPSCSSSLVSKRKRAVIDDFSVLKQRCLRKVVFDIITKPNTGDSDEFLTPAEKLLNSIDLVQKAVNEELNRLKGTPAAMEAERRKKVRTLMSMR